MYNDKVIEIFKNPKNVGEIKNPSGVGMVGNEVCGDIMKLYLQIDDKDIITDAKFKTFGCAAAIVSSSVATEIIKGKKIEDALKIENQEILDYLGGLPPQKIHCSVLAKEAIEEAVKDYRSKQARGKKTSEKSGAKKVSKETLSQQKDHTAIAKKAKTAAEPEQKTVKFVKSDIDELIRTSHQLLREIEGGKLLQKTKKGKKSSQKNSK